MYFLYTRAYCWYCIKQEYHRGVEDFLVILCIEQECHRWLEDWNRESMQEYDWVVDVEYHLARLQKNMWEVLQPCCGLRRLPLIGYKFKEKHMSRAARFLPVMAFSGKTVLKPFWYPVF